MPIACCASSTPKKVAAFAGMALAIAGANPGKKALIPFAFHNELTTPPKVGLPGILCNLDLTVSTGNTGNHIATPAVAPAAITAGKLNVPGNPVTGSLGVNLRFTTSYAAKYAALPGASLASVMNVPLYTLRMPPSLKSCRAQSEELLYFSLPSGPGFWIWRSTFTRSMGAVTTVMGTAEKAPAVEICAMENWPSEGTVEKRRTRFLPRS